MATSVASATDNDLRFRGAGSSSAPQVVENAPSSGDGEVKSMAESKGFFELLIQSIWEPGANYAVVMAMNISFFLLLLVLFALAFLTSWNKHVLLLLGVTTILWFAMIWFVMELTKIQTRPDNAPPSDPLMMMPDGPLAGDPIMEEKKQR